MADSDPPSSQRDLPASVLLILVAGSFIGAGTDSLMNRDGEHAVIAYAIGSLFFLFGASWHWTKRIVGPTFSRSVATVAGDFRWWLAVLGLTFVYLGSPQIIDSVKRARQPTPNVNQATGLNVPAKRGDSKPSEIPSLTFPPPLQPPGSAPSIPSITPPTDRLAMTHTGKVRILFDKQKPELKVISRDPSTLNVTITDLYMVGGNFSTLGQIYAPHYWIIRFLFGEGAGIFRAEVSGDAVLEHGVAETRDGYVEAFARWDGNPLISSLPLTPQTQSGELDFDFYK
jgi:hypothetical protein